MGKNIDLLLEKVVLEAEFLNLKANPKVKASGSVIEAKPIGVLVTKDEKGYDEKILAVPSNSVSKEYENVNDLTDLPKLILDQIQHFFEHYKDLEKGKFVKVEEWKNASEAKEILKKSLLVK